jgi:hypothetical protein
VLANETGGPPTATVVPLVIAAAIRNPYAGGYVADLDEIVDRRRAGPEFGRRIVAAAGDGAVAELRQGVPGRRAGEYEHGNAFLTQTFADPVREAVGGGCPGCPRPARSAGRAAARHPAGAQGRALRPLALRHRHGDVRRRAAPDEVVVAFAVATRGRLHARLGGLRADQVAGRDGLR